MMKSKKMVYLPAFAAVLVSVLLIAYSFYAARTGSDISRRREWTARGRRGVEVLVKSLSRSSLWGH
ncbi:hypothetical protein CF651_28460 [Paenibacillus rigui]|uniref:Uncharacterized protein n=1 Tax=Paenibacillus rigui TaxID=554312 RepID=A0A229UHW3_9BACL|nr:hypothetical protein CF651_28460 [Paenibacillus rigui]